MKEKKPMVIILLMMVKIIKSNQKNLLNYQINLKTLPLTQLSNGPVLAKKMNLRINGCKSTMHTGRKVKGAIISLTPDKEVTNRFLKIGTTIILRFFSLVRRSYHIVQCLNRKQQSQGSEGHQQKYSSKRLLPLHLVRSPLIHDRKDLQQAILQSLNIIQSNQIHLQR